jgi:hypothetical protein
MPQARHNAIDRRVDGILMSVILEMGAKLACWQSSAQGRMSPEIYAEGVRYQSRGSRSASTGHYAEGVRYQSRGSRSAPTEP